MNPEAVEYAAKQVCNQLRERTAALKHNADNNRSKLINHPINSNGKLSKN
tara:strand:+ start:483 stop:632 length:150 start_codon:yes stop_codon:yes gene_type:complete